jgi:hypothetical protein
MRKPLPKRMSGATEGLSPQGTVPLTAAGNADGSWESHRRRQSLLYIGGAAPSGCPTENSLAQRQ